MSSSLCGGFLVDRRSLVAFTWTITTVLTLLAFIIAVALMVHVHTHYMRMENYYMEQYEYNNQYNNNNNGESGDGEERSADREELDYYLQLADMSSTSMTFVGVYTVAMAVALNLYGTTAIVGFTSLQGVYIAPCFSSSANPRLRLGIFGGAIIFFANLLLLCAVMFGEVRVEDWYDYRGEDQEGDQQQQQQQQVEQREPYEIERISAIMAITCMFLAAMYTVFAVLLFLYAGTDEESLDEDAVVVHHRKPSSSLPSFATADRSDPRRESFIVGRA